MSEFADHFKLVVSLLHRENIDYAIAGGIVASLYRDQIRATQDIDIAIYSEQSSEKLVEKLLVELHLNPFRIRKADLEGGPMFAIKNKSTPVWMVVGRNENAIGTDFILEKVPWVSEAIARSKSNRVDFGFGPVPCITVEDFLISKLFSYQNQKRRFKDLDDLQSVWINKKNHSFQIEYLAKRLHDLHLKIPKEIKDVIPPELGPFCK